MTMRVWLWAVIAYAVAGLGFVALARHDTGFAMAQLGRSVPLNSGMIAMVVAGTLAFAVVLLRLGRARETRRRVPRALAALAASTLFVAVFTMVKTALPLVFPIWADPVLARLDAALHLGQDPWVLSFRHLPWLSPEAVTVIYVRLWMLPACLLPVVLILFDPDEARVGRYLALHFFVWVGLGNVLAAAFLSVGPVYYDALLGTDRFDGLHAELAATGLAASGLGDVQRFLWAAFEHGEQAVGSGISAFPSVHVGMAAVFGFYMADRFGRAGAVAGAGLTLIYLVLSVHTGWHYAIDGYASIGLVWALRAALIRRDAAARRSDAQARLTEVSAVR